jgi:hypothetical protein
MVWKCDKLRWAIGQHQKGDGVPHTWETASEWPLHKDLVLVPYCSGAAKHNGNVLGLPKGPDGMLRSMAARLRSTKLLDNALDLQGLYII